MLIFHAGADDPFFSRIGCCTKDRKQDQCNSRSRSWRHPVERPLHAAREDSGQSCDAEERNIPVELEAMIYQKYDWQESAKDITQEKQRSHGPPIDKQRTQNNGCDHPGAPSKPESIEVIEIPAISSSKRQHR